MEAIYSRPSNMNAVEHYDLLVDDCTTLNPTDELKIDINLQLNGAMEYNTSYEIVVFEKIWNLLSNKEKEEFVRLKCMQSGILKINWSEQE